MKKTFKTKNEQLEVELKEKEIRDYSNRSPFKQQLIGKLKELQIIPDLNEQIQGGYNYLSYYNSSDGISAEASSESNNTITNNNNLKDKPSVSSNETEGAANESLTQEKETKKTENK